MNKREFIQQYVIAYVSLKMFGIDRDKVQNWDLPEQYTNTAVREGDEAWNALIKINIDE